ncbi:MAG: hypothetical protein WD795_19835 [Woeseia sp.]
MIGKLVATLLVACIASTAFAGSCPLLMKDIDAALGDPTVAEQLSEEQMTEVKQLRKEGEEAHRAGDHPKSMEALARAKAVLGIS